jgi:cytochrome c oxidase subunit 1
MTDRDLSKKQSNSLDAERIEDERLDLERTWADKPGIIGWLSTSDHKRVGFRMIFTAFCFFAFAGVLAVMMRLQLMQPNNHVLGPDLYNQFFTTHGSMMMFLFAVPVMEGMGIYFVPLLIGTRTLAFPRLAALGYYTFLIAGLILCIGLLLNNGPDVGWFAYVPLSGPEYGVGKRYDLWSQMVSISEISALIASTNMIVTVMKLRAPGMSLGRMPLFVWSQVITSIMVIFAMPAVMMASTLLSMDRLTNVSTHFFNQAEGGDPLMWQHLFWFFGHPEVYIIFLPATGMVSMIVTVFSRRKTFGYTALVLSMVATAFIGFGVWVHHMFVTPLPQLGQSIFTAASMMIVVPAGVQIFCWVATLWTGRWNLKTPLVFVLGFFAIFVMGGLSGVMLASVPLDTQLHDTYFVVAHFHFVLIGGAVMPLFGAIYYWFPKFCGRMMNEKAGIAHAVLFFIGFEMVFFPMHILGLIGMPRRVYTYLPETGWGPLNMLASIGGMVMGVSILVFVTNAAYSWFKGKVAAADPWGGDTLEWSIPSPPPQYAYQYQPVVQGRHAVWEMTADAPIVTGLHVNNREVVATSIHDAVPDHRYGVQGPSIWPFIVSLMVGGMFIGFMFTFWSLPIAMALMFFGFLGWFWSNSNEHRPPYAPLEDNPLSDEPAKLKPLEATV